MLQSIVIGNLGSDATVQTANGHQFVSINVAHSERFTDANGVDHERTQWVRCAINGDGGGLLQYLVRGARVCVIGRTRVGTYSSQKERRIVGSVDISVDHIELIGNKPDLVPSMLYDEQGVGYSVLKLFALEDNDLKRLAIAQGQYKTLRTPNGREFNVFDNGMVMPAATNEQQKPDKQ